MPPLTAGSGNHLFAVYNANRMRLLGAASAVVLVVVAFAALLVRQESQRPARHTDPTSLGSLIALWREKTFQALALTVLLLVLYLCLVRAVPAIAAWIMGLRGYRAQGVETLQSWLDPVTALQSVLEPGLENATALAPAYGFAAVMVTLCVILAGWGILRLRAWNPSGEPIMQRERPEEEEEKDRARAHAAPGALREVWANPILWREVRTRAYGRRPLLVKAAYVLVLALICYYALAPVFAAESPAALRGQEIIPAAAKGLVPVAVLSLLLLSAQAVTAITSERDGGALDLLLVTDLTPKEFLLLSLLMRRAGEVLSRTLIADQIWEINFESNTNFVDVHIRRLRSKLDDPFDQKLIHTVRGKGYVLEERTVPC